jgi:hypothetical protein
VIVFGGGTVSVLKKFKIRVGVSDDDEVPHRANPNVDVAAQQAAQSCLSRNWKGFDAKYIKPVMCAVPSPGLDSSSSVIKTITQYVVSCLFLLLHRIVACPPSSTWCTCIHERVSE